MEDARNGKYAETIPYTDREDEFGEFARVIEMFYRSAQERRQQRAANIELVNTSFGETLAALASRDLTGRLAKEVPQEYRALRDNLNNATAQLDAALAEIDTRAKDIASGSVEINRAAQEMSARTQRDAAAIEQTSAAVNELTATVKKSAEGAGQANGAAASAKQKAEQGSAVVRGAVDAIRAIAQSSSEITQIISVINDIAFQTNLLALNAGVEAARAGDAGKGFAVVASEVRSLAQRSAEAAKQIKQIITASEEQVENGVRLVEESGGAFGQIVGEIATIYDLVATIAASQHEQSMALGEIDSAIQQLDQATQQNAAMAEQSCAASDALAGYAKDLETQVAQFHVSGREQAPRPHVRAA
jgi:methyl-accepting chemotaxis protein